MTILDAIILGLVEGISIGPVTLRFYALADLLGILLGYWIYSFFGGRGSAGVDWVRWAVAVLTAAVLVVIASAATSRTRQDV